MNRWEIAKVRELGGRAVGTLFFTAFGVIWVMSSLGFLRKLTLPIGVVVVAVGLLMVARASRLMRRMRYIERDFPHPLTAKEERRDRVFLWANVVEWVGIPVAVGVLIALRRPEWIVPAIAVIVGLHLLPMARGFGYWPHYVTAAALIGWSLLTVVALPRGKIPGYGALGTGLILLLSAGYTLTRATTSARQMGLDV